MLTYEQGVTPFRDTNRLSENDKAALMGGTLQKLVAQPYRFGRATIPSDPRIQTDWLLAAEEFKRLVKVRNSIFHGQPGSLPTGEQRLFREGIAWTPTMLDNATAQFEACSHTLILKLLVDTFTPLEAQITALDTEINQRSKSDPAARRLMTIPGVGPIASTATASSGPAGQRWHLQNSGRGGVG